MTFLTELRCAHAVHSAFFRGAHTVGQLAHRTGLPANVCAEWAKALRLPLESPRPVHRAPPLKKKEPFEGLRFDI